MSADPRIFRGALIAGPNEFEPDDGRMASQIGLQNIDETLSFTLSFEGSTGTWLMSPGDKLGLRLKNAVKKVILTPVSGTPAYQLIIG
jgi:hypothetical protein